MKPPCQTSGFATGGGGGGGVKVWLARLMRSAHNFKQSIRIETKVFRIALKKWSGKYLTNLTSRYSPELSVNSADHNYAVFYSLVGDEL